MATNPKKTRPQRTGGRRTAARLIRPGAPSPAVRVRQGEDAVGLVRQLDLSPPASRIGVSRDGRWVAVAAASRRAGNLSLYDLTNGSVAWRATLDASSARVFALDDGGCIAITQSGRVGAGNADLRFFDPRGELRAAARLDDKLTEVQVVDGVVIVGCRDGHLYTYDLRGAPAWQYRVPPHAGLDHDPDDPYYRSCPYFIRAPFAGDHILFSSWDRLFMLDRSGALRWTWRTETDARKLGFAVPAQPQVASNAHYRLLGVARTASADDVRRAFRKKAFATHPDRNADDPRAAEQFKQAMRAYEAIKAAGRPGAGGRRLSIAIHPALGPNAISGLAVGDDGRAIASSRDGLTFIDAAGRVTQRLDAGVGTLQASADLRCIVHAHWQSLRVYTPHGLVHVHPTGRLYHVAVRCDGERVIAWSGRQLLAFDAAGQLLAELECTKLVAGVAFLANDQLLISAGKLLWLAFTSRTQPGAG